MLSPSVLGSFFHPVYSGIPGWARLIVLILCIFGGVSRHDTWVLCDEDRWLLMGLGSAMLRGRMTRAVMNSGPTEVTVGSIRNDY